MADLKPNATQNPRRFRVSLVKGSQRWHFRWEQGEEAALIDAIAGLARDPEIPFDWFDAAIVCKHIAQPESARAATASATSSNPSVHVSQNKATSE